MVDYYTHLGGLTAITEAFAQQIADAQGKQALESLQKNHSYATLGAFIDHLLYQAGPAKVELRRLARAAALWRDIGQYIATVAQVRSELEAMVNDPLQAGIVTRYNAIYDTLQTTLKPQFNTLNARLQALYAQLKDLTHIVPHGQGLDQPVTQWNWRDLYLSRGSGALADTIFQKAQAEGSAEAQAFAAGVAANYVSNAVGSSFLNRTTGGARRSHPHRDRVASYSVGAWIRKNSAGAQLSPSQLRSRLSFGSPVQPTLPPALKNIVLQALTDVYAGHGLGPLPDLDRGYRNLLRHLRLLDSFQPLPPPVPINDTIYVKILSAGTTIQTQPPDVPPDTPAPGSSSQPWYEELPWWAWALFAVCVAVVAACYLTGICGPITKDPYPGPFQQDPPGTTAVQSFLTSDDALQSVSYMFTLHNQLYDMANNSRLIMKFLGLLYAEEADLPMGEFRQFTRIPFRETPDFRKPVGNPDLFLAFPTSVQETPRVHNPPFFPGDFPDRILANPLHEDVATFGAKLWLAQLQGSAAAAPFDLAASNLNLDADREFLQLCWELKGNSSTLDNPLNFTILGYHSI